MARPRSEQTQLVKEKLIARLGGGFHPPGQRFYSNRGLAAQFGISYQTADRLIRELVREGWLERKPSAGTYVSGRTAAWQGVVLVFHERAKRAGSFGARLHGDLIKALDHMALQHMVKWSSDHVPARLPDGWLPVLWECPQTMASLADGRKAMVLLNDTPQPGLASSFADSVACDDFSGGAAAAELLRQVGQPGGFAVLGGPKRDHRSRQRVAGFVSIAKTAKVFWAATWDAQAAEKLAGKIMKTRPAGVFCCSDRLAVGLLDGGMKASIVGFDDAPVAEVLDLTTIAIPWQEMVAGAAGIIRSRISGHAGAAAKLIFTPRPVMRTSHRRL
jgi:DNA-binding transcriptional regulator YhcF (GntR family)